MKGRDGEIFRTCLPWQLLQLLATAILAVILVLYGNSSYGNNLLRPL